MAGKDEIKEKIDIADYIGQFVPLKLAGRNFKGVCPFHKEKSPSFFVSPERQSFHCFGCGESGDIFTFYEKMEGVTFFEALKDLADYAGVELNDFKPDQDYQLKDKLIEIHTLAAKYFHYLLTSHQSGKIGLDYLLNRGVPQSQIKDFNLGFAPNSWQSLTSFLLKKKYDPQTLEQSGLCLKSYQNHNLYDRFRGRIIFPLYDLRGSIVGFSGRILPQFDDGKSGKYINSPETPIYHKSKMLFPINYSKEHIRKAKKVIVVEGELDALASIKAGVKNVVAVKGTAFTADQVKIISRYADTIILSLDSDAAGVKAAKRSITVIKDFDLNVRVLLIEGGKDPDEIVKANPAQWRDIVKKTDDVYDFFIATAFAQFDANTPQGQKEISQELIPLFNQVQNQIVRNHFVKKLADKLAVSPEIIEKEMDRVSKTSTLSQSAHPSVSPQDQKPSESNLSDQLLTQLLTLVINYYSTLNIDQIPVSDFPSSAITQILQKIISSKPKDLNSFGNTLPEHLLPSFNLSFLAEAPNLDGKKLQQQYNFLISRIAKMTLRDKLSQVSIRLKSLSDPSDLENIKRQYNDILVRFSSYK